MTRIKVIIGSNYGDEGKGVMSYFMTKNAKQSYTGSKILNILYNGGIQRGHTAANHVFHCFGAGALEGADTYYHKDFLVNPTGWFLEYIDLRDNFNCEPRLFIDPNCRVTTPYDIIINQLLEEKRGAKRHGSCGLGIRETVVRSETYPIYAKDLLDEFKLYNKLCEIRDVYFPKRCKELGFAPDVIEDKQKNTSVDDFFATAHHMITHDRDKVVFKTLDKEWLHSYDTVIYEGAQGLLLSEQNMADYPHLTPSTTGSEIIVNDLRDLFSPGDTLEVCYMTRSYLTRHGAGPLPNECRKEDISNKIEDKTNLPNDWQGSLRFGYLDVDSLLKRIFYDFKWYSYNFKALLSIGITHLDYTNNQLQLANDSMSINDFVDKIKQTHKINKIYAFDGINKSPKYFL